ncbi:MAG TPA: PfkB family carbohydrate kinase [Longimicrobiales bacterium]|nr:PfkB family carbohydrate kinase [Longimicrobiales bacterium]
MDEANGTEPERSPPASLARAPRALVAGEVLFDHFPDGRRVLGGAPFNVSWHLCAFGGDPLLLSAVGDDEEGRDVRDAMESWGLSTLGLTVDGERPTGRVEVDVTDGHPSFSIPPDQPWDHLDARVVLDLPEVHEASLLYHGSLALRQDGSWSAVREIARRLELPTFVDLNLRDPWWTRERVDWCLKTATWLKLSDEELATLTGRPTASLGECEEEALRLRRERGVPVLVVTRGPEGSLAVTRDGGVRHAEGVEVRDLIDTVGAGDAFSAVYCHGILRGWSEDVILRRAAAFAAEACRYRGATSGDLTIYERHHRAWSEEDVEAPSAEGRDRLYVLSLSVHGLVRGTDIELGRDADTGGQVSYVVDEARALAVHPAVERVDVVTRAVHDRNVDETYAKPTEPLGEGARIVRFPFGPRRYLKKESLWPYLDGLMDQLTRWIRAQERLPDVIHGHYADAGYVGAQLAKLLGVPFVFTGHSLGRVKKARLEADGGDPATLDERYHFPERIEAEEQALEAASLVVASTRQEVRRQYEGYDHYEPARMKVIPPGVDLARFSPPTSYAVEPPIAGELARFLSDPGKPMVLALARADERKNFEGLIRAFGETPGLREAANLVIVAGNRDDIAEMDQAPRRVLTRILLAIDRYDLHGSVAYPKHHRPEDVPNLYRLAARSRGVFVNPALTEPFGLTLLEAAATGLPVVATDDGGPRDIVEACEHGLLVDALDPDAMGQAILSALTERGRWARWSKSAVSRVHERFTWRSHAREYVRSVLEARAHTPPAPPLHRAGNRLSRMDRMLVTDLDGTLTGDEEALADLRDRLAGCEGVGFGVATGRSLDEARDLLDALDAPAPDVFITASGGGIHYGRRLLRDRSWERQIRYRWEPDAIREALEALPGLKPVKGAEEHPYRLRYVVRPESDLDGRDVRRHLRQAGLHATAILDHGVHMDIVPVRASPGLAIRFFCFKWNLPPERLLVAGDSGNDADMLSGDTLGVVVANHTPELETLRGNPRIYFTEAPHAGGILEGIEHYDFFGAIEVPDEEPE